MKELIHILFSDIQNTYQNVLATLGEKPQIGIISLLISLLTPMTNIAPILQVVSLLLAIVIGVLTIEAKWSERKKRIEKEGA